MANPLLKPKFFEKASTQSLADDQRMSIEGTVNKTIILFALTFLGALWAWKTDVTNHELLKSMMIGGMVIALVLALVIIFKPTIAKFISPIYAISEGVALGALSLFFNQMYPGIVLQAVLLTFTLFLCTLALYKFRIVRVTAKLKKGIIIATAGVALFYVFSILGSFIGLRIPSLHSMGLFGIGISAAIVILATFNFLVDFDMIERAEKMGAPKFMEWYGAFSILLTLVWLYVEVLRLLSLLMSDR